MHKQVAIAKVNWKNEFMKKWQTKKKKKKEEEKMIREWMNVLTIAEAL